MGKKARLETLRKNVERARIHKARTTNSFFEQTTKTKKMFLCTGRKGKRIPNTPLLSSIIVLLCRPSTEGGHREIIPKIFQITIITEDCYV